MVSQALVDAREDLNIRVYEIWSGWRQEHALAEFEQTQREALRPSGNKRGGYSASSSEVARQWPVFWTLVAAFAIGGLIGLRFW